MNDNLSRWVQTCAKAHHLLRDRDHYIHEVRKRIIDDTIHISGQDWTISTLRQDLENEKKAYQGEIEQLNKLRSEQGSRIAQLEQDLNKSYYSETILHARAETAKKKLEPLAKENERLRRELTAKNQELEGVHKLRADFENLWGQYEAERKHNTDVESYMPTMFANF